MIAKVHVIITEQCMELQEREDPNLLFKATTGFMNTWLYDLKTKSILHSEKNGNLNYDQKSLPSSQQHQINADDFFSDIQGNVHKGLFGLCGHC